jgi:YVTN family beta-propeller protein
MDMGELSISYPAAYIVNGQSNTISVINLKTDAVTGTISLGDASMPGHGGMNAGINWPHHVYMNPAKSQLSIGVPGTDLSAGHAGGMTGMTGKTAILDANNGSVMKIIELSKMNHNAVFSPDGSEIWTSQMHDAGTVLVYNANTYVLKNTIEVGADPAEITFSSDGKKVFVANGGSNNVTIIEQSTKNILATINVGDDPVGAWPSADGKMYVDNEGGQSISVIDVASLSVEATINLGFMPAFALYNSMNSELWVSDPTGGKVHYWLKTGTRWNKAGDFRTGAGTHAIAFTKDNMKAYVTNQEDASVSIVNTINHTIIKKIPVGKKPNGIVIKE